MPLMHRACNFGAKNSKDFACFYLKFFSVLELAIKSGSHTYLVEVIAYDSGNLLTPDTKLNWN